MTTTTIYKQKLEAQIEFAKSRMAEASNHISHGTWDGYIQGLRYALAELPVEPGACKKQCTCSATDLQPFGECICSESKVAPI